MFQTGLGRLITTITFLPMAVAGADSGELEYCQEAKSNLLLGFMWLRNTVLVFVTDCVAQTQDKRQYKSISCGV